MKIILNYNNQNCINENTIGFYIKYSLMSGWSDCQQVCLRISRVGNTKQLSDKLYICINYCILIFSFDHYFSINVFFGLFFLMSNTASGHASCLPKSFFFFCTISRTGTSHKSKHQIFQCYFSLFRLKTEEYLKAFKP